MANPEVLIEIYSIPQTFVKIRSEKTQKAKRYHRSAFPDRQTSR